jgi:predicted RNA binding protein YcfA (HicA-like mRNA interferase family)
MRPAGLLRRRNRLAKRRGWQIELTGGRRSKVRLNGGRSTVPRHAADLKTGTFRGILKQLGLRDDDLEI